MGRNTHTHTWVVISSRSGRQFTCYLSVPSFCAQVQSGRHDNQTHPPSETGSSEVVGHPRSPWHPPLLVGRSMRQLGERLAHMADEAAVAPPTPSLQILMQALVSPLRVHADGRHAPTTVGGSSKTQLYFLKREKSLTFGSIHSVAWAT